MFTSIKQFFSRTVGLEAYRRWSNHMHSRGERVQRRDISVFGAGVEAAGKRFTALEEAQEALRSLPGAIQSFRDRAHQRSRAAGIAFDVLSGVGLGAAITAALFGAWWWLPALLWFLLYAGVTATAATIAWAVFRAAGIGIRALLERNSASASAAEKAATRELRAIEGIHDELTQ